MESFDPFAVLGLPRRYDVSRAEVERAYLERSAALHPDMITRSDLGIEGNDAEWPISELNRAKAALDDPEQRAVVLWKLLGGVDDKALPPQFLMEMMEVREEIEAAKGDAAAAAKWEKWAREQRAEYQGRVSSLFPCAADTAATLKRIKMELNAWRYIERLIEQLGD